ncbi:M12 family metallo-peptidase [Luminiphilus sp.]|nr:M12 family metallo-peptidase [Luminiphilus sp.]
MPSLAHWFVAISVILATGVQADSSYWQDSPQSDLESAKLARTAPLPAEYRILTVDLEQLTEKLDASARRGGTPVTIDLPHPEGGFSAFEMQPSEVMSPELAVKFPEIRAYKGYSLGGTQATVQLEITPRGLTAQVLSPGERWMLDPASAGRPDLVLSYFAKSTESEGRQWQCQHESHDDSPLPSSLKDSLSRDGDSAQSRSIGQNLRTYRLAVAATGEYTKKFGTKADGMSAIVTTINRVKGIYEKEVGVSFTLIGNNDSIVYPDPLTDPFTGNNDARVLINESQAVIDDVIGVDDYDIGHTFSTGGGRGSGTRALYFKQGKRYYRERRSTGRRV